MSDIKPQPSNNMTMTTTDLIKLNNLPLAGRLVSDELGLGIHASRRAGAGVEFEQYRAYQPGDDPKRIDWRMLARTDRYVVRESSTESHRHIRFLLDLSGSMNYTEQGIRRLDFAKILLASLAWIGHRQGDSMSLYGLKNGAIVPMVPPSSRAFQEILYATETAEATGTWLPENPKFPDFQAKGNDLLVFISDLLQIDDEWLALIGALAGPRREIRLLQILGEQETAFNLTGFYRFQDLETGREVEVQAEAVQARVRQGMANYLNQLDQALQLPHVRLIRATLTEAPALVLSRFLQL
jgi:uncharacterized protein (DUF58 family)